jgi:hypothetical protein
MQVQYYWRVFLHIAKLIHAVHRMGHNICAHREAHVNEKKISKLTALSHFQERMIRFDVCMPGRNKQV